MGKTNGCGVVVENTGSKVGTVGRDGVEAGLFNRTNITAIPTRRSMMMIASEMIRMT